MKNHIHNGTRDKLFNYYYVNKNVFVSVENEKKKNINTRGEL